MRLLSLFLLLCFFSTLNAQSTSKQEQWFGLSNIFFKNKAVQSERQSTSNPALTYMNIEEDEQYALGLSWRKLKKNGMYRQIDFLELDWHRLKGLTSISSSQSPVTEPTRGSEIKQFSVLAGYRAGKLFPLTAWLRADVGARGFAFYQWYELTPLTSAGFPDRTKSIGLGINLSLGLNFKIHDRVNIGYDILPAALRAYWNEDRLDNPILTEEQKRERSTKVYTNFFESSFSTRNFRLNYVF